MGVDARFWRLGLAAAAFLAAGEGAAETSCSGLVQAGCLERFGAGVAAVSPESDCGRQFARYRACIEKLAASAPGPATTGSDGCSEDRAARLWTSAERSGSCGAYRAFRAACPDTPEAVFAAGAMKDLGCDGAAAPLIAGNALVSPKPATAIGGGAVEQAAQYYDFGDFDAPGVGRCAGATSMLKWLADERGATPPEAEYKALYDFEAEIARTLPAGATQGGVTPSGAQVRYTVVSRGAVLPGPSSDDAAVLAIYLEYQGHGVQGRYNGSFFDGRWETACG